MLNMAGGFMAVLVNIDGKILKAKAFKNFPSQFKPSEIINRRAIDFIDKKYRARLMRKIKETILHKRPALYFARLSTGTERVGRFLPKRNSGSECFILIYGVVQDTPDQQTRRVRHAKN